jgi:hypothetical protein
VVFADYKLLVPDEGSETTRKQLVEHYTELLNLIVVQELRDPKGLFSFSFFWSCIHVHNHT